MPLAVEPVDDPADPRLADFRDLRDPELRLRRGLFVAEGGLIVRRLVEGGRFRVRAALGTPSGLGDLTDTLARADGTPRIYVASQALMERLAGYPFHRGCLAVAERGPDLDPRALIAAPGRQLLVGLDDVSDPDNVGALFRNAAAFGVDGVLLTRGCGDPLYRKAIRTSAGATLQLPFSRAVDWPACLEALRRAAYTVMALTPDPDAVDVATLADEVGDRVGPGVQLPRLALLAGSEGRGLGPESRRAADHRVCIRMTPGVDSLNVATATGIALHALARARGRRR